MPQPAVRGGKPVELVFVTGDLALVGSGIALADGAIGDVIQIRRTNDGRTIQAKIVADGRAQANF